MKYIDLTIVINESTPVIPGDLRPVFEQIATTEKDGWNERRVTMNSHFGTHIDFPRHMIENGKTQNDFDLEDFIGNGKVIDARGQKDINSSLDGVQPGDIVLILTNNSQDTTSDKYFTEAPVISEGLAHNLVKKKVKMIGIDSWGPDNDPYPVHKLLLSKDILIVENMVNLQALLGKKFKVFVAPLRLDLADGAPVRVFAEIED